MEINTCLFGDCREILPTLPDKSVQMCVTSPPYFGLRDYGVEGQMGLEPTVEEYVNNLVAVFREVNRILRDDGTLWLNLGNCYGLGKQLLGIPWRVAFALQADGWYLRQDIIWHKPNPMPESVKDRCTKSHEYLFLLSKSPRYYFDGEAIKEPFADKRNGNPGKYSSSLKVCSTLVIPHGKGVTGEGWNFERKATGRNRRSVWSIPTRSYKGAHFACFPPALVEPCILAGCPEGGAVLDPFFGSGTTGEVAKKLGRNWIGIELNPEYGALQSARIA